MLNSNLKTRFITAMVLIFFVIGALFSSALLFQIILLLLASGMLYEWYEMTNGSLFDRLFGIVAISVPISSVFILILNSSDYKHIILVYLLNIWVIDTCAMFGGKALQGPKLAPVLSPNKTWSGLICGAIGSIFAFIICDKIFDSVFIYTGLELIPFGILFTIIAQNSDLLVSFFKRKHGIKDSGTIFPGHGGMLDRCDSFILTAPILLYIA